jgi:hypothetical protein
MNPASVLRLCLEFAALLVQSRKLAAGDPVLPPGPQPDPSVRCINNGVQGDPRPSTPQLGKMFSEMKVRNAVAPNPNHDQSTVVRDGPDQSVATGAFASGKKSGSEPRTTGHINGLSRRVVCYLFTLKPEILSNAPWFSFPRPSLTARC